ncbi:hypothetical protein ATCV1_z652R [Acanthocystis turfacea chlorella virus 1]|uniref:Uncharacterized protein z652R n=1 Tax=Chlorovirus heliozoae TaxID=322019 RepID=A7K9R2_9PHYC|nr:hypothetical protein ATCV1_z652R [Acanthocystis turfacea chlorella virus 1]ABT16786.1 hypothetical protein ATCV1_z652R [Acanthocystis turfacea chlorella virus 1]
METRSLPPIATTLPVFTRSVEGLGTGTGAGLGTVVGLVADTETNAYGAARLCTTYTVWPFLNPWLTLLTVFRRVFPPAM